VGPLKGGVPWLRRRLSAPSWMSLEAAAVTIRGLWSRMYLRTCINSNPPWTTGVSTGPEMLAREIPLFATQSGHRHGRSSLQKSITEATGYSEESRAYVHIGPEQVSSMIWHSFCRANAWNTSPNLRRACQTAPCAAAWAQTPHDTYSPNWNALTFDTFRHNILLFLALTKHGDVMPQRNGQTFSGLMVDQCLPKI